MTLQLDKRSTDQKVQQTGNQLFHKGDANYLTQPVVKGVAKSPSRTAASQARTLRSTQAQRQRIRSRSRGTGLPQIPIVRPGQQSFNQNPPIKYPPEGQSPLFADLGPVYLREPTYLASLPTAACDPEPTNGLDGLLGRHPIEFRLQRASRRSLWLSSASRGD